MFIAVTEICKFSPVRDDTKMDRVAKFLVPMLCVGTHIKAEKPEVVEMFFMQTRGPAAGNGTRSTGLHSHAKHGNERK